MSDALEQASLIMVPSGYEDGTLGSLKPTDGTGDFTFSRGSDISATRVNEDGYIEKGYENLLLQSNSFDTTWTNFNTTETGGQADKDGGTDAWLLTKSAANGMIYQSITSSGIQTLSVYAKKGTNSWMQIYAVGSSNVRAYYNLGDGTLGAYSLNTIDRNIEDIGSGWYRCSVTFNSSITNVRIFVSDGNNDDTGTSGSIYIQDAMLNQGLVAYPYVETTTAPVAGGILEDMPRLDYSGSCPALLLEPQRTNKIPHSEYLDTLEYTKSNSTNTGDTIEAPDGGIAFLYNVGSYIFLNTSGPEVNSPPDGTSKAFSFYAKSDTNGYQISYRNPDGTNTTTSLSNTEWKRIIAVGNHTDNNLMLHDNRILGSVGNVAFWGVQLEEGSYPTSYIPTYGTSQTRLGDSAFISSATGVVGQTEGTILLESNLFEEGGAAFSIYTNGSNRGLFYYFGNGSIRWLVQTGSGAQATIFGDINVGQTNKIIMTYKENDFRLYANGVLQGSDTSGDLPASFNQLRFDSGATAPFVGEHKQLVVFPTALSDDECIALTTIS